MRTRLFGGAALVAAFAFVGCSSDPTPLGVGPEAGSRAYTQSNYSSAIGVAGGSLIGDTVKLVVPASALSGSVSFQLETSVVSGMNQGAFSPAGQTFAVPATLSIQKPANAAPGAVYHIFRWDAATEEWVDLGGTTTAGWVWAEVEEVQESYVVDVVQ